MDDSLRLGDKAPRFTLSSTDGEVSLTQFKGEKLVLFFYPRADTPGCTREAQEFGALKGDFERAGTRLLGISADPVQTQAAFGAKYRIPLCLAADPAHDTLKAFGVWGKKTMFGRPYEGIVRTTFLIDREGRIARIWRKVKVAGHAQEVLDSATAL